MQTNFDIVRLLEREGSAILASAQFFRAKASRALLSYLLQETVAGRGDQISEYSIAMDLLQRGGDFDPSTDPIVRVRMRRLRAAVEKYYTQNGTGEGYLEFPLGGYAMHYVGVDNDVDAANPPQKKRLPAFRTRDGRTFVALPVFVIAVLVGIVVSVIYFTGFYGADEYDDRTHHEKGLTIAISPLNNLTGNLANNHYEKAIQRRLAADFQLFDRAKITLLNSRAVDPPVDIDYVLSGAILDVTDEIDIVVELSSDEGGAPIFTYRVQRQREGLAETGALRSISHEISGKIFGHGGALSKAETDRGQENLSGQGLFQCVTFVETFLVTYDLDTFLKASQCFDPHLDHIDSHVVAAAMRGALMTHAVPEFNLMPMQDIPRHLQVSPQFIRQYAEELADLYPHASVSFLLLGFVMNAAGDGEAAIQMLENTRDINPASAEARAALSMAYVSVEQYDRALTLARQAISGNMHPQPYRVLPIIVAGIMAENPDIIAEGLALYRPIKFPHEPVFRFVAASFLGDRGTVNLLHPEIVAMDNLLIGLPNYFQGENLQKKLIEVLEREGIFLSENN